MKKNEEKQNILTAKEEANFAVNGSNAAQKIQLKEEINFDLQHKQIKVCLLFPSYGLMNSSLTIMPINLSLTIPLSKKNFL